MDSGTKKHKPRYDRVMPRVYSKSSINANSKISVTRHDTPSVRVGGNPSISIENFSAFSELPLVLGDCSPEEKPPKRTFVVKPRKTLKSLEPVKLPVSTSKLSEVHTKGRKPCVPFSAPSLLNERALGWSNSRARQCYSSRSHSKLQELKSEIKAYKEKEDLLKLRSRLYKRCGLVLDDIGQLVQDKAVQAEGIESPPADIRRTEWLRVICRLDLSNKPARSYTVCQEHFQPSDILPGNVRRKLKRNAIPCLKLPNLYNVDEKVDKCSQTEETSGLPHSVETVTNLSSNTQSKPEEALTTGPLSRDSILGTVLRRSQWLRLIAREDLIDKASTYRVCEVHFDPRDIKIKRTRKLLKANSSPCSQLPTRTKEDKQTRIETVPVSSLRHTEATNILMLFDNPSSDTWAPLQTSKFWNSEDNMRIQSSRRQGTELPDQVAVNSYLLCSEITSSHVDEPCALPATTPCVIIETLRRILNDVGFVLKKIENYISLLDKDVKKYEYTPPATL